VDSILVLIRSEKDDTVKVNSLIFLAEYTSENDGDSSSGLHYARAARDIANQISWAKGVLKANMALGNVYYNFKDLSRSAQFYKTADSIAVELEDHSSAAIALFNLSLAYLEAASYAKSLDCNKAILTLNQPAEFIVKVLGNMGIIYKKVGDYPNSLIYYDSSLTITNKLIKKTNGNSMYVEQRGALLVTLGDIYLSMKQYDSALKNYRVALSTSQETGSLLLSVMSLKGIAGVYDYLLSFSEALDSYEKALKISKKLKRRIYEAEILNDPGRLYLKTGNIDEAYRCADSSLQLSEENHYYKQLAVTSITLGRIYTIQKKNKQAVAFLQRSIAICGQSCVLEDEKDAWEALSYTYEQMKQPARALDAYRHFITIRDSIYNIERANALTRIDLQYKFNEQKQADAAINKLKMQKQRMYTYAGFAGLILTLLLAFSIFRNYSHEKKANIAISNANVTIMDEKQRAEALLLNILPENVAQELKDYGSVQARLFENTSIMFTDFVNFTEASERLSPEDLVAELHECFMGFDQIISKYKVEKIKTVGDAYVAASGLPDHNPHHATELMRAAIECRNFMTERRKQLGGKTFSMRIGIHSGTVIAGIVGVKKFAYDIWGDTVNTAARMEQYSEQDKINISQTTYDLVKNEFTCTDRGEIDAKHKGKMRMYFVEA
jgi:adenylate cyclase